MSKNHIELSHLANTRVVDLMADVDIEVKDSSGGVDVSTALDEAIVERCKGQIQLVNGKYNIRLLAVITSED